MIEIHKDCLVVADHQAWLKWWTGPIINFEDITPELLSSSDLIILAPEDAKYVKTQCKQILEWKQQGMLGDTKIMLATYKGRHLWTPEYDHLVELWTVHSKSERLVLDSDRLVFIPLCLKPPTVSLADTDSGYVFMGGRKWREPHVGLEAIAASGFPGKVITDFAPPGDYPGIDIVREKIPKENYMAVMARSRLVIVPLRQTPISHGHVDVVTAILVGKPVVVTAGCSCDDYVEHGVNGLLVSDNSVESWRNAISEAWERADEFSMAAKLAAPKYHVSNYARYISEVAESILLSS